MEDNVTMKQMEDLCREIFPAIDTAVKALQKPGIQDQVSVYLGSGGYVSINLNAGEWELMRLHQAADVHIRHNKTIPAEKGKE